MIQFGNDKIEEIYYGSDKIKAVYHGADLVYHSKPSKPSYAILTNGTRIDFERWNTPIDNFANTALQATKDGIILNGIGYRKNVIKELVFGESYSNTANFPAGFLRQYVSLEKVDLLGFTNITSIEFEAFYNCKLLKIIDLSNSKNITSIGSSVFRYIDNLEALIMGTLSPPSVGTNFLRNSSIQRILVPCESVQAYKTRTIWRDFADIISCPATKAPTILFKANEVNVGFKYFRGDGGYSITNARIELSIANGTFSVVGTNLAYDVSEYSGIRVKYIQENSTNIETKVAIGLTNSPTTNDNRMYRQFINGSPGTYEREAIFEFTTVEGVVDKYGASIYIQYQEGFADEKPNAKITITEIEMI